MKTEIPYHNPRNVPIAGEGWRFCLLGEEIHTGDEFWNTIKLIWVPSKSPYLGKSITERDSVYRTRAPLPESWLFQDECKPSGIVLDWSKLPEEAMCAAKDKLGIWWGYDREVVRDESRGCFWFPHNEGQRWFICNDKEPEKDWQDSLTPRPDEKVCGTCKGHGMIGGHTGQTPESYDEWVAPCPDCNPPEPRKVPLSAKDCPPGSVFRQEVNIMGDGEPSGCYFTPCYVGPTLISFKGFTCSFQELMDTSWLILRPGSTWEPCYREVTE